MTLAENFGWWDAVRTVCTASCWAKMGILGPVTARSMGPVTERTAKFVLYGVFRYFRPILPTFLEKKPPAQKAGKTSTAKSEYSGKAKYKYSWD